MQVTWCGTLAAISLLDRVYSAVLYRIDWNEDRNAPLLALREVAGDFDSEAQREEALHADGHPDEGRR
jgi:hypothetical protein